MKLCVIDASVIGSLILPDEAALLLPQVMPVMVEGRALVPQHWRLEVLNLGRNALRRQRIDRDQLAKALGLLAQYRIHIDDSTNHHAWGRCLAFADRYNLTAYDAAYLELAHRAGVPLLTLDKALARAAQAENLGILAE